MAVRDWYMCTALSQTVILPDSGHGIGVSDKSAETILVVTLIVLPQYPYRTPVVPLWYPDRTPKVAFIVTLKIALQKVPL